MVVLGVGAVFHERVTPVPRPMVVLGGGAVSYERGTPAVILPPSPSACRRHGNRVAPDGGDNPPP